MKKRKMIKKLMSMMLTAFMTVSLASAAAVTKAQAADEFNPEEGLLAHYLLETDVKDSSGNGKDAVITDGATGVTFEQDALTLAGGDKNSSNYVTLPDGLFDNQDTVTVSLWINNHNMKGNYSAFFFGSKAQSNSLPLNYFLLNPCSPNGNYKAVFTDSVNTGSPWVTEKGINDSTYQTTTSGFMNQWKLYTIVISNKTLTGYLDGVKLGTVELSRQVSDFGTGLKAHIGKSQYLNDSLYAGSFRDLRIYNKALDDAQVQKVYQIGVNRGKLLEDKAAISIGDTNNVITDLTLPETGANGSTITWVSDNPAVVSNNGEITLGTSAQSANLTATVTLGSDSVTRTFAVTTPAEADVESVVKDKVQIPYTITAKTKLPVSIGDISVTWDDGAEDVIFPDGTVKATEENTRISLTAAITYNGKKYSKTFNVLVMEKTAEYVMSYTRANVNAALGESMHLAYSADGENYTALHNNTGILFAKADLSTSVAGTTRTLTTPYLFRMADDRIGVLAVRNDGEIIYAVTEDLMAYEENTISLNTELGISEPECEYNGTEYVITWKGSDGKLYKNTTADFQIISAPVEISSRSKGEVNTNIANAVPCNILPVTKEEIDALKAKLAPLENTGVEEKEYSFKVKTGESLSEEDTKSTITAKYNDGTTDEIPIIWDMSSVDYTKEGTYTVTGQAKLTEYPVLNGRADPNIYQYNGKYYFIATGETQSQSQVCIREADTPQELFAAQDHELIPNVGKPRWAPELHEIDGKLYIFLAIGDAWNKVQSCVMELKEGGDPTAKEDWTEAVQVTRQDGSTLYTGGITLDMTYFEQSGVHYLCWAQRAIGSPNGTSDLWIATIDPENPYQITSDPVCILRCQYGWDRVDTTVDEGPFVIKNDGKIYLTFSGAGVSNYYVVGLLTADEDADLMEPASWSQTNYPILSSESVAGEYGPGHSCFSVDEDGRAIFVYHMKPNGGTRSATVRRVHWGPDGSPVLDMTIDKELKAEYRTVTGTVTVADKFSADKEKLQKEVENAIGADKKDQYTEESWNVYEKALKDAQTVLAKEDAAQTEVDAALKALMDARERLEEKPVELPFVDVAEDAWYYDAVYYNYVVQTMTGKDDTHFAPDEALARAQFAMILYRMNDTPDVEYKATFPDVADNVWYTDAILWAADTGVVTGYSDSGKFGPSDRINREQMAVMMYRYAKYKEYESDAPTDISGYKDASKVSVFAKEAMEWAVGNGIISGKDGGTVLDPQGNATRAECATIIMRFLEKFEK